MAARTKKIRHDENTRSKIQASQLINRVQGHALGKVELTPSQLKACEILLRKVMPDLASVDHTGEVELTFIARLPGPVANVDEWRDRYRPMLPAPTGEQ